MLNLEQSIASLGNIRMEMLKGEQSTSWHQSDCRTGYKRPTTGLDLQWVVNPFYKWDKKKG